jgi:hypothetical protein
MKLYRSVRQSFTQITVDTKCYWEYCIIERLQTGAHTGCVKAASRHVGARWNLTVLPTFRFWGFSDFNCQWLIDGIFRSHTQNFVLALVTYIHTYIRTYLRTYLLTPWSRILPEKLTGSQLVKKFPASHGTWRFITAFTSARHLSLSWASSIQFMPPPHSSSWRYILILSSHLRLGLPSGLCPSCFPTKTLFYISLLLKLSG